MTEDAEVSDEFVFNLNNVAECDDDVQPKKAKRKIENAKSDYIPITKEMVALAQSVNPLNKRLTDVLEVRKKIQNLFTFFLMSEI